MKGKRRGVVGGLFHDSAVEAWKLGSSERWQIWMAKGRRHHGIEIAQAQFV